MMQNAVDVLKFANSTLVYDTSEMIASGTLFTLSIVGMIGSGAIIFASFFYQNSPHGLIILSLCFSDFISCVNTFIITLSHLTLGGLLIGQAGLDQCMIGGFIHLLTFSISLVSLSLIAAERYFSVFYGGEHSRQVTFAIICSWIYAIGYASTSMTSGYNFRLLSGRTSCAPLCTNSPMFPYCIFGGISTSIGASIATYFYWKLFAFYRGTVTRRKNAKKEDKEKKLLRKFRIIVLSFIILTFPFMSGFLYEAISGEPMLPVFGHISVILIFLNQSSNSYLLYWLDPAIRQQVNEIFHVDVVASKLSRKNFKDTPEVLPLSRQDSSAAGGGISKPCRSVGDALSPTIKL